MKVFKCVLIDKNKKKVTRIIEAENEQSLLLKIKQMEYFLVSKEEVVKETKAIRKMKAKDLIIFCRQISVMLNSGITIIRAINILESKSSNPKTKIIYERIYELMQKGNSLSVAMREQQVFPNILINMVEAGETGGILEINLAKMGEHFEKENKLNNKIKGAMMYPIILSIVAIIVVIFLVTMVLPTFFELYAGQELPLITQILVAVSNFLTKYWAFVIAAVAILIMVVPIICKLRPIRTRIDKFKLYAPVIGKLNQTIYSARCARGFATLYASGLDMIELLRMVSLIIGNVVIQDKFQDVIQKVSRGEYISTSLEDAKVFDPMFTSMVYIGEESGSIDTILESAADYFDEEADAASTRIVSLLEPLMIIIMALIIGFIVAAVMLPMYGMMQYIS
ncbi:type II secretion system F family protein [Anaerorhabdus sp.]|uniref:type II secretion system F family protein n=1 Tax=Anaerorhabdus sp. TaxID=1872524 RepID=UPI002FCA5122